MGVLRKRKWTQREKEGEIISPRDSQQPLKGGEMSSLFAQYKNSRFPNDGFHGEVC